MVGERVTTLRLLHRRAKALFESRHSPIRLRNLIVSLTRSVASFRTMHVETYNRARRYSRLNNLFARKEKKTRYHEILRKSIKKKENQ